MEKTREKEFCQAFDDILHGKEGNYLLPFFWQHDGHKEDLPRHIQAIWDSGCRAFCLESRPFEDFCGDSWWENLAIILAEAQKRDMKVWILDDKHFPTGYANGITQKYPQRRRWFVREHHLDVMGPAADLAIPVPAHDEEETLLAACAILRADGDEALRGDPLPLTLSDDGDFAYLDVPEGCWRVFFVYKTRRGATDYIDMLTPEGPAALLEAVYEPHYAHFGSYFGNTIAGFFSDEPSLDARWVGPWGKDEGGYYRTVGQPGVALPWADAVLDALGAPAEQLPGLWYPWRGHAPQLRLAYMDAVTKLWRQNFSRQLGDWCRAHGVQYIGHIIEDMGAHARLGCSAGHFFRALDGQDMSGIDIVLHQVMPGMARQSTAASISEGVTDPTFFHYMLAQLAASQAWQSPAMAGRALCEVFGAYGWAESLPTMRWLIDFLLVRGISYFVPHAFSDIYPDPDCPPHFYADGNDPQFAGFGALMRYTNRVAHLLAGSVKESGGAILYAAEAEWMDADCMPAQLPAKTLYDAHIPYDFLPLDALAAAETDGGKFSVNGRRFHFLIVPGCRWLPAAFWQAAARLQAAGVPIFFVGRRPGDPDARPGTKKPACGEQISLEALPFEIPRRKVFENYFDCNQSLVRLGRFRRGKTDIFLIHNEAPHALHTVVKVPYIGNGLLLDLFAQDYRHITLPNGLVPLHLAPGESCVVMFGGVEETEDYPRQYHWYAAKQLDCRWDIALCETGREQGFRPYRQASPLFNITGRDALPHFSGLMQYTAHLQLPADGPFALDLGQVGVAARLEINGEDLGWRVSAPYFWLLEGHLHPGDNLVQVTVANTLAHRLRDPFSPYTALPPSGLLGPVKLWRGHKKWWFAPWPTLTGPRFYREQYTDKDTFPGKDDFEETENFWNAMWDEDEGGERFWSKFPEGSAEAFRAYFEPYASEWRVPRWRRSPKKG